MNKKILTILLIISASFAVSCSSLSNWKNRKPTAKVEDISLKSISFDDMTVDLNISIDNPYPIGISVAKIQLETLIDKNQLFKTVTPDKFKIKASGKKRNSFDIKLKYSDLIRISKNYMNKDHVLLTVNTRIDIAMPDVPGLPKTIEIPLNINKKLPTIRPSFKLKNFDVDLPSRNQVVQALKKARKSPFAVGRILAVFAGHGSSKGVSELQDLDLKFGVKFDIEVANQAKTRFNLNSLNYDIKLNGVNFMKGVSSNIRNEGKKSIIRLTNTFSAKQLNKSLINAMTSNSSNFSFSGYATIMLPKEFSDEPMRIDINKSGKASK